MCIAKPTANGARLTTESGLVYYPDTPQGHAAAAQDMQNMGGGKGEGSQPPAANPNPPDTTDCTAYTDSLWDTPCSKYYKFAHMKYKPVPTNGLTPAQIACNWQKTCQNILDPLVDAGLKISISSGYRTSAFDASLGGSGKGDHTSGCAVDIQILNGDTTESAKTIFKYVGAHLTFTQLIYEGRWTHVAYNGVSPPSVATLVTRTGTSPYQNGGGKSGSALPPDLRWA